MFENRVLRDLRGWKKQKAGENWRMGWVELVAYMAEKRTEMHTEFWLEILKKWYCLEGLCLPKMQVLKWILKKHGGMKWTGFIWLRIGTNGW